MHNLIMLPGLYVLMKNAKWTVVLARKPPAARAKWAHWDHVMSGMLVLAVLLQFVYKAANGRLAFMLQPCHVMTGFLAVIAELPAHHRRFDEWFNIYLHLLYAPFLALLFPGAYTSELQTVVVVHSRAEIWQLTLAFRRSGLGPVRRSPCILLASFFDAPGPSVLHWHGQVHCVCAADSHWLAGYVCVPRRRAYHVRHVVQCEPQLHVAPSPRCRK